MWRFIAHFSSVTNEGVSRLVRSGGKGGEVCGVEAKGF